MMTASQTLPLQSVVADATAVVIFILNCFSFFTNKVVYDDVCCTVDSQAAA